ncbi:hypothetical protein BKA93DRAFT_747759 [Sparassis latifolia]
MSTNLLATVHRRDKIEDGKPSEPSSFLGCASGFRAGIYRHSMASWDRIVDSGKSYRGWRSQRRVAAMQACDWVHDTLIHLRGGAPSRISGACRVKASSLSRPRVTELQLRPRAVMLPPEKNMALAALTPTTSLETPGKAQQPFWSPWLVTWKRYGPSCRWHCERRHTLDVQNLVRMPYLASCGCTIAEESFVLANDTSADSTGGPAQTAVSIFLPDR